MSLVRKHSVSIRGHRTSFSVEDPFFEILEQMAAVRDMPLAQLVAEIDAARPRESNLSSALRIEALEWVKAQSTKQARGS